MEDIIEMATISSRGQICIPNSIREKMSLKDGSKIIFALTGDSLLMKKVSMETFAEITRPLKEAKKKINEEEVVDFIHKIRKEKGKMKVVLDTNILVSGTFWKGDSSRILDLIEAKEIELILSENLIDEYNEVIKREEITDKIQNKELILNKSIQKIIQNSTIVEPSNSFDIIKEDIDDNKVLDCAFEGKSDFIITNDNHLLKINKFQGIKIINPKDFLIEYYKNYQK